MAIDVLIVDDEEGIRNLVRGILQDEGYSVRLAANAEDAYKLIEKKVPDLLILDIWLQESHHDGMQILSNIKKIHNYLPAIMISGHGTIETAVAAIKKGAYDFIEKPFKADRLLLMIERAIENAALKKENESLRQRAERISDEMVGTTPMIQSIQQILEKAAPTSSRVLITGEAGTGKNLAARYIHQNSKRAEGPFIAVNCSSLQPERLEVELFGSVDGILGEPAKIGALELAQGGTLLLDEVAGLPMEVQGKVLRALQDNTYKKVGDVRPMNMDARILATTSEDIERALQSGTFRQDLYYRLNVISINMPPLRKRAYDIPSLVEALAGSIAREGGQLMKPFSPEALQALQAYHWPGNIRQLRNVLEWVSIMSARQPAEVFGIDCLPPEVTGSGGVEESFEMSVSGAQSTMNQNLINLTLREAREVFERDYLLAQIKRFGGNVSRTAQFVGMERSALHRKLKSLDVAGMDKEQESDQIMPLTKKSVRS